MLHIKLYNIVQETMEVKNAISAQKLMAEFQVFLEQEKTNTETDIAQMLPRNTRPETKMQLQSGGSMAQINSFWEDLSNQIKQKKENASRIIQKLWNIEYLLTTMPASNRAMIQPCFSRLCAEADIVMSKITDCMKTQCDENQSRSSVCFHEIATTLQSSS